MRISSLPVLLVAALLASSALIPRSPPAASPTHARAGGAAKVDSGPPSASPRAAIQVPTADPGLVQFSRTLGRSPEDVAKLKAEYFCDLARALRQRCASLPRNGEQMEFCLKAGGYFTHSRHCGFQP